MGCIDGHCIKNSNNKIFLRSSALYHLIHFLQIKRFHSLLIERASRNLQKITQFKTLFHILMEDTEEESREELASLLADRKV